MIQGEKSGIFPPNTRENIELSFSILGTAFVVDSEFHKASGGLPARDWVQAVLKGKRVKSKVKGGENKKVFVHKHSISKQGRLAFLSPEG